MQELLKKLNEVDARNRLAAIVGDYEKTLALLAALKAGEIALEQIALTPNGWNIVNVVVEPDAPTPAPTHHETIVDVSVPAPAAA